MRMRSKIAGIVSALALCFSMTSLSMAQDSIPVPIDIVISNSPAAAFSWTIAESIPFKDLRYSFEPQTTTGAMTITVTDDRGTKAGWILQVSGTDFRGRNTGDVIPIGNLALAQGPVQVLQGQTSPMPTTHSLAAVTDSPQEVMSAANGAGAGRYSVQFTGTLQVPGGQRVDTYSSTLTVNQIAAP